MKKCPNCGAECDDEANFCTECEADLRENAGAVPEDVIEDTEAPIAEDAPAVAPAAPPAKKAAPAATAAPAAPAQKTVAAAAATQTGPVFFSGNKAHGGLSNQSQPNQAGQFIPKRAESHIVKALISTICCCPPFGIAALIFASQVDAKLNANDCGGALEASKKATYWSNLAIALALLFITVSLIAGMLQDGGMAAETLLNMYKDR
ncbi:MAG: CD225/dispanin family protein [Chitinispirillia bacterium]|nr:CD225/dispanin family protein [Chitinispirillia bacterium]MCL2241387.1 CD225/dispanin family protein [Chitinispirillia bacterium]